MATVSRRDNHGNMLILAVVSLSVLALVIGAFSFGYINLLQGKRKADTAIDKAALEAVKDISRIVIDNPHFGLVGLVDSASGDSTKRNINGINTIEATCRLDTVIAEQLDNTTMQYLAAQDLKYLSEARAQLNKAIQKAAAGEVVLDKDKQPIDLLADVNRVFDANGYRKGQGQRSGSLKVIVGTLTGPAGTNTPVPVPADDSITILNSNFANGMRFYKSGISYQCGKGQVVFSPVGDEPTLIDNNMFTAKVPETAALTVVQVSGQQELNAPSTTGPKHGSINVNATAMVGGPRVTPPSATLCVSFRQGIPQTPDDLCHSVKSLMNASMIPASGGTSTDEPWFGAGNWLNAGERGIGPSGIDIASNGDGYHGRSSDNPSVALAITVYDWLKTMGLRPRVDSVVSTLSQDFNAVKGNDVKLSCHPKGMVQAAYAESSESGRLPPAGGIYNIAQESGEQDKRDYRIRDYDKEHAEQYKAVFDHQPAVSSLAKQPDVKVFALSEGAPVTVTGDSVGLFPKLEEAVFKGLASSSRPQRSIAQLSLDAATQVVSEQTAVSDNAKEHIKTAEEQEKKATEDLERVKKELDISNKWLDKYLPLGKEGVGAWLAAGYDKMFLNVSPDNLKEHIRELERLIQEHNKTIEMAKQQQTCYSQERDEAIRVRDRANTVRFNATQALAQGKLVLVNIGNFSATRFDDGSALADQVMSDNPSEFGQTSGIGPIRGGGSGKGGDKHPGSGGSGNDGRPPRRPPPGPPPGDGGGGGGNNGGKGSGSGGDKGGKPGGGMEGETWRGTPGGGPEGGPGMSSEIGLPTSGGPTSSSGPGRGSGSGGGSGGGEIGGIRGGGVPGSSGGPGRGGNGGGASGGPGPGQHGPVVFTEMAPTYGTQSLAFNLGNGRLTTPSDVATVEAIKGTGPIATGEGQDWTAPQVKGKPGCEFYQPVVTAISHAPKAGGSSFFQPAYAGRGFLLGRNDAQSSNAGGQERTFLFMVRDDVSRKADTDWLSLDKSPGTIVVIPRSDSPYVGHMTLSGQVHYQALDCLRTIHGDVEVFWSVQARNNGANPEGKYFACQPSPDPRLPPGVYEWQLYCPIVKPTNHYVETLYSPDGQVAKYESAPSIPPFHG